MAESREALGRKLVDVVAVVAVVENVVAVDFEIAVDVVDAVVADVVDAVVADVVDAAVVDDAVADVVAVVGLVDTGA